MYYVNTNGCAREGEIGTYWIVSRNPAHQSAMRMRTVSMVGVASVPRGSIIIAMERASRNDYYNNSAPLLRVTGAQVRIRYWYVVSAKMAIYCA